LGLQQQTGVQVSSDNFAITAPTNNSKVNLGISQLVTVTWIHNGTPFAGQTVNIAATRGSVVPVSPASLPLITDANGQVQVSISSGSAGPGIVSATGTGVSAQLTLDFVAVTPSQVSLQAGPATVAVGAQSTISATVRDVANNLVEGATVDFLLSADPTNGSLQSASVVTNALGVAQTVYAAGTTSSGANGVVISATVRGAAIPPSTTYPAKTFVTVGGQTVFLSLGTGNTIDTSKGAAVYQITYTVFAVDATGAAQANVPIALSVLPVAYGKGFMSGCPGGTNWFANYTTPTNDAFAYNATKMCRNEDSDYTGNINSLVGKDYNTNGRLDPGNIAVVSPGSGSTDSAGRLDVTVTYPRDHSYWVQVALVAKTNVSGTESSATSTFVLQGAITDYACGVGPPGPVSPYGQAATCANPN
jgi:hypothetical protein